MAEQRGINQYTDEALRQQAEDIQQQLAQRYADIQRQYAQPPQAAIPSAPGLDWERFAAANPVQPAPATPATPTVRQNTGTLGDIGTAAKYSLQSVPGMLTSLADIPVAALTGRPLVSEVAENFGKGTGFQPGKWKAETRKEYSPEVQQQLREYEATQGLSGAAGYLLQHPGLAGLMALESAAPMVAGGVGGRAAMAVGKLAGRTVGTSAAAGIGEGAIMAGGSMQQMIDAGVDPRTAAALATGVGIGGGFLGAAGGKLAERLGVVNPEAVFLPGAQRAATEAGKAAADTAKRTLTQNLLAGGRRIGGGAVAEGLFEEAPQSALEQMAQNLGEGKPLTEGVGKAVGTGAVVGGLMGGAFNILPPRQTDMLEGKTSDVKGTEPAAIGGEVPPAAVPGATEAAAAAAEAEKAAAPVEGEPTSVKTFVEGMTPSATTQPPLTVLPLEATPAQVAIASLVDAYNTNATAVQIKQLKDSIALLNEGLPDAEKIEVKARDTKTALAQKLQNYVAKIGAAPDTQENIELDAGLEAALDALEQRDAAKAAPKKGRKGKGKAAPAAPGSLAAMGEPTPTAAPVKGPQKPPAERGTIKALMYALQGYIPGVSQPKQEDAATWLANARRAAAVDTAFPKARALMRRVHLATDSLEKFVNQISSGDVIRDPITGEAFKQAGTMPNVREWYAQKLPPGMYENLTQAQRIRYDQLNTELKDAFAALDEEVGANNLAKAQELSKYLVFNKPSVLGGATPLTISRYTEPRPATRFSQSYFDYKNEDLGRAGVSRRPMRSESGLATRLGEDPTAYVQNILDGNTLFKGQKKPGPVQEKDAASNLLTHLENVAAQPMTKMLSEQLRRIMQKRGILDKIKITLVNTQRGEDGRVGQFAPIVDDPNWVGEITLYTRGFNHETILHEFVHAVASDFIRRNPDHPAVKNLQTLARQLATTAGQVEADQPGSPLAQVLRILGQNDGNPQEFLSYGLTYRDLQDHMKLIEAKGPLAKLGNIWKGFVQWVKAMVGVNAVPNSVFERYLEASSSIFNEIYAQEGSFTPMGSEALAQVQPPEGEQNAIQVEGAAALPVQPRAEAGEGVGRQVRSAEEATGEGQAQVQAQGQAATEEEVKTQQFATAEAERARATETFRRVQEQAKAATAQLDQEAQQAALRVVRAGENATTVDLTKAQTPRVATTLTSREKYTKTVEDMLKRGGAKIMDFLAPEDTALKRFLIKVLVNTVDSFGTPDMYRSLVMQYRTAKKNIVAATYGEAPVLQALNIEEKQAMFDYIMAGDETLLKGLDKDAQASIRKMREEYDRLLNEAKAMRLIDPKFAKYDLVDFIKWQDKVRAVYKDEIAAGKLKPSKKADRFHIEKIDSTQFIISNGDNRVGDRYRLATDGTNLYMVKEGNSPTEKPGVVYYSKDTRLYTLRGMDSGNVQFVFERPATLQELKAQGKVDDFVTSLVWTIQDLSNRVEGAKFFGGMVDMNQKMAVGDRFILDTPPVDKDGKVLTNRILDYKRLVATNNKAQLAKARMPGYWVLVPNEPSKWGMMAGKYVAGPVFTSLEDYHSDDPLVNWQTFNHSMVLWKKYKTVYSIGTHVNNIVGNFVLAYFYDLPVRNIAASMRIVSKVMLGKMNELSATDLALWREFDASGATLGDIRRAEFNPEITAELDKPTQSKGEARGLIETLTRWEGIKGMVKSVDGRLSSIYSNEDNVFRLAAYMTHVQNQNALNYTLPVEQRKSMAEIKAEAGKFAKESFVDYEINAPLIDLARKTGLPFIAWPYRMIPILLKIAVTKPWKMATVLGSIYALNAVAYAMSGGDEDEERRVLPEYMKGNIFGIPGLPTYIRMPFGERGKEAWVLGVGKLIPGGDMTAIGEMGIPNMLMPSGPIIGVLMALFGYDPFTARSFREDTMSTGEKATATLDYMYKYMAPTSAVGLTNFFTKFGDKGPLGAEINQYAAAARLLGLNMRAVDLPEAQYTMYKGIEATQREYRAAMAKRWRQEMREGNPDYASANADVQAMVERMLKSVNEQLGTK